MASFSRWPNATAEGRARNRRVVLVVSRNLDVRRSLTGTGTAMHNRMRR
jgi:hypothetical protein